MVEIQMVKEETLMDLTGFLVSRAAEISDARDNRRKEIMVIAVDLDGVLCEGEYWGAGEPTPIAQNIERINGLAARHFIVIHTARRKELATATIRWLDKYGVIYHAVRFDKMPADIYIDDKAFNFKLETHDNGIDSYPPKGEKDEMAKSAVCCGNCHRPDNGGDGGERGYEVYL